MNTYPVGLDLGLKPGYHTAQAQQLEREAPLPPHGLQALRTALIQPDDGGPQGLALVVEVDHRGSLSGQGHAGHSLLGHRSQGPQLLARFTEGSPVEKRVLFRPSRVDRIIGFDGHTRLDHEIAPQVEQQGTHALGAAVDGQQVVFLSQGRLPLVPLDANHISGNDSSWAAYP